MASAIPISALPAPPAPLAPRDIPGHTAGTIRGAIPVEIVGQAAGKSGAPVAARGAGLAPRFVAAAASAFALTASSKSLA